jgi:hypothetical protein
MQSNSAHKIVGAAHLFHVKKVQSSSSDMQSKEISQNCTPDYQSYKMKFTVTVQRIFYSHKKKRTNSRVQPNIKFSFYPPRTDHTNGRVKRIK